MDKHKETYISFSHLAELSVQPEGFRSVYQLQLNSNPDPTIVEGPLFLNITDNRLENIRPQEVDILFANQLQSGTLKDDYR